MTWTTRKTDLSAPRRQLLLLMSRLNYGSIENLLIRDAEPVFSPAPRLTRLIKLSADEGPRPEIRFDDFELKAQVIALFRRFDRDRHFTIERLEVSGGLPFKMAVEEPVS